MNRLSRLMGSALLCAAGTVLFSTSLWARSTVMHVQVPFEFHAGSKTFSAGLYRLEIGDDRRILLMGPKGEQAYMIPPVRDFDQNNQDQSGVAFRKYGQDYFLARIVSRAGNGYYEWPPTSVEKVLSKRANVQIAWIRSAKPATP